jgi:hypothetical protein
MVDLGHILPVLYVVVLLLVSGCMAMLVGGNAGAGLCFFLGVMLGPFGVITAAILGNRPRAPDAAEATTGPQRQRGGSGLPKPIAVARTTECPSCAQAFCTDDLERGREYACPFCREKFEAQ